MLELLQFVTSGFWTFVGCWILLAIVCATIVNSVRALVSACRPIKCTCSKIGGSQNGTHNTRP